MQIKNLADAEAALQPYMPLVKQLTGKDTTLDRIRPLMKLLGNPQDRLKVIHIAGTSGKTSTAYYLAALLQATGQKVGLTISPYLDSITERVQIDGHPIAEEVFCRELGSFLEIVQQLDQPPSYFELLCAFAFWIFERQGVDFDCAVIETGLGGLYDATNVVTRPDKVCVITDIGFDHTSILGNSLTEITTQKIGIAHDNNQVFIYRQGEEVMNVVVDETAKRHAKLHLTTEAEQYEQWAKTLDPMPDYQRRNWLLAHFVYRELCRQGRLSSATSEAVRNTQHLLIPGRMDTRQVKGKTLIMDGAHNAQKLTAFIKSFQHLYPGIKPAVLVSFKEDKEYERLVPLLNGFASRIVITAFDTVQDIPVRSVSPVHLAKVFHHHLDGPAVQAIENQEEAFDALLVGSEKICVITGSFYLLHQMRNNKRIHDQINRSN